MGEPYMQTHNLYAILQVSSKASPREIDEAYARLRRGKGSDKEGYKVLKHAYKVLSSRNDREIYDAEIAQLSSARKMLAASRGKGEGGEAEPREMSGGGARKGPIGGLRGLLPDLPRVMAAPPTPPPAGARTRLQRVPVPQYPADRSASPHNPHSPASPLGPSPNSTSSSNSNSHSSSIAHGVTSRQVRSPSSQGHRDQDPRRANSPVSPHHPQGLYAPRPVNGTARHGQSQGYGRGHGHRGGQGHTRAASMPPMTSPLGHPPTNHVNGNGNGIVNGNGVINGIQNAPSRLSADITELDPWANLEASKRKSAMQHDRRLRAEYENHLVTHPLPTAHEAFTMTDTAGMPIGKGYTVKWADKTGLRTWTGTTRGKSSGGVLSGVVWSYT